MLHDEADLSERFRQSARKLGIILYQQDSNGSLPSSDDLAPLADCKLNAGGFTIQPLFNLVSASFQVRAVGFSLERSNRRSL